MRRWVLPTHIVVNGTKMVPAVGLTEATRIVVTFAINGKGRSRVHKVRYLRPSDFETFPN